ncbi:MAG: urease accessory protein UreF [Alphaproteobacteria bacterium]
MATAIEPLSGAALYRLMSWLSPSYPVSAYSFSHGLEWAVEHEPLRDAAGLGDWIRTVVAHGSGRNDAILFAAAWRAIAGGTDEALAEASDLALALAGCRERREETLTQGRAFWRTTLDVWPHPDLARLAAVTGEAPPYPVAVGCTAAAHGVPLLPSVEAYLHAFAANLVSAGVRLIPLGQTDGQRLVASLAPTVMQVAVEAADSTLDDVGGCALAADIAAMQHETQTVRLFRS